MKYPDSWFFLRIFQNFLCIFCESRGSTSWQPRAEIFFTVLSILYRNGISFSELMQFLFVFLDPPNLHRGLNCMVFYLHWCFICTHALSAWVLYMLILYHFFGLFLLQFLWNFFVGGRLSFLEGGGGKY